MTRRAAESACRPISPGVGRTFSSHAAARARSFEPMCMRREAMIDPLSIVDQPLELLIAASEEATLAFHGPLVTYSRKVFIPLTRLCRDVCHYCTFATAPRQVAAPFLSREEVL